MTHKKNALTLPAKVPRTTPGFVWFVSLQMVTGKMLPSNGCVAMARYCHRSDLKLQLEWEYITTNPFEDSIARKFSTP